MGRTAIGAGLCCGAQLSRNGSARGAVDGEVGRDCGPVGGAQGSGTDKSRRVFGVDRYVFCSLLWFVVLHCIHSPRAILSENNCRFLTPEPKKKRTNQKLTYEPFI